MEAVVGYLDNPPLHRYGLLPTLEYGTSPAAGATFTHTVDGRYYERLVTVFARLVTDANAGDRTVYLEWRNDADARYAMAGAPVTQPASTTTDYAFQPWLGQPDWSVDGTVLVPLPQLLVPPTWDWRLNVADIEATDQLSQVRFLVERFFTGVPE